MMLANNPNAKGPSIVIEGDATIIDALAAPGSPSDSESSVNGWAFVSRASTDITSNHVLREVSSDGSHNPGLSPFHLSGLFSI